mmetsp:Transcript_116334/g.231935  ORF Transcript_116334/g.231935 Transcript_116334/m.231935 type:complete len:104 (-) Transcript_116334:376-687(-)
MHIAESSLPVGTGPMAILATRIYDPAVGPSSVSFGATIEGSPRPAMWGAMLPIRCPNNRSVEDVDYKNLLAVIYRAILVLKSIAECGRNIVFDISKENGRPCP